MDPRRVALSALLVLVVAAGCLGGPGTKPTPDPSATTTATPTQTPTPTASPTATVMPGTPTPTPSERPPSTANCPAYVSVDPVDEVPDDATVIPYENLSEERRSEFDAALSEGDVEIDDGGEAYSFWVDRPYVRYEGTVYRAVVAVC
ncbi:hypothetical protein NDI76_14770 [Halogeometricum sp. S1BR25-6]|uniref:DUF7979 domain-containing protein n=1 Tax=Halogeometricum salsisoli TaxID=2950536 RepID=A0ABU2GGS3_9EURY|nr:hypothetical protein [Halogeometricum sp. S1BR25-6]MDS0300007.1 hypothetical protein [Halogeometricum sp. S1BR25-6]